MIQKMHDFFRKRKYDKLFKIEPSKDDANVYIIERRENTKSNYVAIGEIVIYSPPAYDLTPSSSLSADELEYLIKHARKLAKMDGFIQTYIN